MGLWPYASLGAGLELSSLPHLAGELRYSLCLNNQTGQEEETEDLEREGLEGERYMEEEIDEGGCEETFLLSLT